MAKQIRIRSRLSVWMAAALVLFLPTIGRAAPLLYGFSGTVLTSADPAIAVNETYTGLLQYDPQAVLTFTGGNYKDYSDPTLQARFTFAGASLTFTGGSMRVTDFNFGSPVFNSITTTGTSANYSIVNFDFTPSAGTLAPNYNIPTDLTLFTAVNGSARDFTNGTTYLLRFTVGNITLVPEPATLSLLVFGGLMLTSRRRHGG